MTTSTSLIAPLSTSVTTAPPKEGTQLLGVQILRGIAALAVVVHHVFEESHALFGAHGLPKPLVLFGAAGVDLFFVISGFIMLHTTWSEFGRPGAPGRFLLRRVVRIFPLYWAFLCLVLLAKSSGAMYRSLEITPEILFGSALLLPTSGLVIGVAWTLVFEMYFYYLFATWLRSKRAGIAVLGVAASIAIIGLSATLLPTSNLRHYLTNPIVFEFVLGLGLAWLLRSGRSLPRRWHLIALGTLGIALASLFAPADTTAGLAKEVRFLCWGVPAALIVTASLAPVAARSRGAQLLVYLGNASYALYLSHEFVMIGYARLLKSSTVSALLPGAAWVVLITALSLALGFATHQWLERPLTRFFRLRFAEHKPAPAAA
jgi:exopolysaccharide production protein ExoZ